MSQNPNSCGYLSDVAEAISAGTALAEPTVLDEEAGLYGVVVPNGFVIRELDAKLDGPRFSDRPRRKTGIPVFTVSDGFEYYVSGHSGPGSLTYADPDDLSLVCLLNGHEPGDPGWGDHRPVLRLKSTPEWDRWIANDRRLLDQVAFAEFIEECLDDIVDPPGATMLEVATSFRAHTAVEFNRATRLQDGQTQLNYTESTTAAAGAAGTIVIPERFSIGVKPFDGSEFYKVGARLRYRMGSGAVKLGYLLDKPGEVVRTAFDDVCGKVEAASGVHVVFGRP